MLAVTNWLASFGRKGFTVVRARRNAATPSRLTKAPRSSANNDKARRNEPASGTAGSSGDSSHMAKPNSAATKGGGSLFSRNVIGRALIVFCPTELILRAGIEIAGIVALVQLLGRIAPGAIDHAPALHSRPLGDLLGPTIHMLVTAGIEEFRGLVGLIAHQRAIPRPNRHIGNRVIIADDIRMLGQTTIQHIQLPLHLHGVAIDRILILLWRIGIKMPETTTQQGRAAHLPEQPRAALGALG